MKKHKRMIISIAVFLALWLSGATLWWLGYADPNDGMNTGDVFAITFFLGGPVWAAIRAYGIL